MYLDQYQQDIGRDWNMGDWNMEDWNWVLEYGGLEMGTRIRGTGNGH